MKSDLPRFDPVIHAPTRLQIAALLSAVSDAEFATVREATGVSDSVLSKHLKQMEEAGYVRLHKATLDGRVRTRLSMTGAGARPSPPTSAPCRCWRGERDPRGGVAYCAGTAAAVGRA